MGVRGTVIAMLVLAALVATDSASSSGASGSRAAPPRFRVLVFSKTTGFRHDSIPVAIATIRRLGDEHRDHGSPDAHAPSVARPQPGRRLVLVVPAPPRRGLVAPLGRAV